VLEQLHSERPDDRELRTYLGGVYATAGRLAEARTVLEGVLKQFPDDFDATIHLATAYMFAGSFGDADRFVVRALDLRSGNADAIRLRGVIAWRSGRLDDAERWLAAAAVANPNDAKALGWIGTIRLERNRAAGALEAFRQALARDPLLADALVGGAAAATAAGAFEDASRWVARAKRVAPTHPRLAEVEGRLNNRGRS
jgi:predicted Zn-dependent protease